MNYIMLKGGDNRDYEQKRFVHDVLSRGFTKSRR